MHHDNPIADLHAMCSPSARHQLAPFDDQHPAAERNVHTEQRDGHMHTYSVVLRLDVSLVQYIDVYTSILFDGLTMRREQLTDQCFKRDSGLLDYCIAGCTTMLGGGECTASHSSSSLERPILRVCCMSHAAAPAMLFFPHSSLNSFTLLGSLRRIPANHACDLAGSGSTPARYPSFPSFLLQPQLALPYCPGRRWRTPFMPVEFVVAALRSGT